VNYLPKTDRKPPDRVLRHNMRYSMIDAAVFSVMIGMVLPFLGVFLMRMGGGGGQVAFLTSLPALAGILPLLIRRKRRSVPKDPLHTAASAALFNRLFFLAFALLALLPRGSITAWLIIVCASAMAIPGMRSNVAWTEFMGEAIPEPARRRFFAWRNILSSLVSMLATLGGGLILDRLAGPWNYSVLFGGSFLATMVSLFFLRGMQRPSQHTDQTIGAAGLEWLFPDWRFVFFLLGVALLFLGLNVTVPLTVVYHVRLLHLTNQAISYLASVGALAAVATFSLWAWLSVHWGERLVLAISATILAVGAGIYSFISSLTGLIVLNALLGMAMAGLNLTCFNFLLSVAPQSRRGFAVTLFNLVVSLAAFCGPLLGGLFSGGRAALAAGFLAAAVLRVLSGVFFSLARDAVRGRVFNRPSFRLSSLRKSSRSVAMKTGI